MHSPPQDSTEPRPAPAVRARVRPTPGQWLANLLAPGAGLLLAGAWWQGLLLAGAFLACAHLSLLWIGIWPYEPPPWAPYVICALALAVYVGAQYKLPHVARKRAAEADAAVRRACLIAARRAMEAGDPGGALAALEPVAGWAEGDVLIAVRIAEAHSAAGDEQAARVAWQRVRRVDRHGLYRPYAR